MGIQQIERSDRLPILGKIRLGVRKEAKSGAQYPVTVEHFVLHDAPGVSAIYGDDPKELDIIFVSDDFDVSIPTWLKWYSAGIRKSDGSVVGGKLNCYGNGALDGVPGVAHHYAKKDPKTKVVPTRPCLQEKCPDWRDAKGNQQCKPTMKVVCLLPRVSWYGAYVIDTTSIISMESFHAQLRHVRALNNGVIKFTPFKIVREETAVTFQDPTGAQQTSRQFIMHLRPNEGFIEKHGKSVQEKLGVFRASNLVLTSQDKAALLEAPMEDCFPVDDMAAEAAPASITPQDLLMDPEVSALFDEAASLTGKTWSEKQKLLAIRRRESEPDMKAAVVSELAKIIGAAKEKAAASAVQNV